MKLSLIMAYYDNPSMLARQYEEIANYPPLIKDQIEYIVVDDGSPRWPAGKVPRPAGLPPLKILRITVDVRWNQDAARNLGVHHSEGEWLLLTDMDHLVPSDTVRRALTNKNDPKRVYRFSRVSAPEMLWYKHHPNSWLMTRVMYDTIGGYDERFAGYYGTDGEFQTRVIAHAREIIQLDEIIVRVPREVISDASTTTYERKAEYDKACIRRITQRRQLDPYWKPMRLSFPYEVVL